VLAKPADQRLGRWVFEQVDDVVAVGVDEDGAVAASATKREFIHPEDPRRRNWWFRQCPNQAQQRRAAGRFVLACAQSTARSATQHESDCLQIGAQPACAPRVPLHN